MDFTALKNFMDHLVSWRIPGNGICVCVEGNEVFSYASGYADVESKIPMTLEHFINIYSCTKIATVTAALQLYEQGEYLLDDPLYEFIPEYRDMYISDHKGIRKAQNPITLRHLFTMTSGLSYNLDTPAYKKAKELTDGKMDTQTVVRCLASDPLVFEPGSSWNYSMSHDVLGAVIEIVSGKRLRDYVRNSIFEPLDMRCSLFENTSVRDRMAVQYEYVDGNGSDHIAQKTGAVDQNNGYCKSIGPESILFLGPNFDSGGSGITSTIADYSKFCVALANGGVGATGEKILSAGTIELMRTNQLNQQQMSAFNWPQMKGYGYGLGVRTLIDKSAGSTGNLGEFGWGGAAGANVLIDSELKLSVFYAHHMCNPQEAYYQPRLRNVLYGCIL